MLFVLSKVIWLIFSPFNLILLFLSLGFCFYLFKIRLLSKFFYISSFILFLISGIVPTGTYLGYALEKNFHKSLIVPDDIKGILILSGSTNPYLTKQYNQVSLNSSAERLFEAYKIVKKRKIEIIFSGGPAYINDSNLNDSESAKQFFLEMDFDLSRIIFENKSRNTYENIIFSKKLAKPSFNENWLVVSSASHLRRVMNVSSKANWNLIPYATDFNHPKKYKFKLSFNFLSNIYQFEKASHEWIGLFYYLLSGKADKI